MIECIKVVNLERSPERLARFIALHPGVPAERFPAVDGGTLDRDACVRDGIITDDNHYRTGAIGCAMSHINLWRECAAGTIPFHVVEDDIILRHDFQAMASAALATLADWDIVLWTHNLDWPLQIRPSPGFGVVVVQYDYEALQHEAFVSATAPTTLMPLVAAAGTGCYSVSPRGAARILNDCLPIGTAMPRYLEKLEGGWTNTGIDVELSRHYADWQAFVALPQLAAANHDQNNSSIRGHLAAMHDFRIANRAPID